MRYPKLQRFVVLLLLLATNAFAFKVGDEIVYKIVHSAVDPGTWVRGVVTRVIGEAEDQRLEIEVDGNRAQVPVSMCRVVDAPAANAASNSGQDILGDHFDVEEEAKIGSLIKKEEKPRYSEFFPDVYTLSKPQYYAELFVDKNYLIMGNLVRAVWDLENHDLRFVSNDQLQIKAFGEISKDFLQKSLRSKRQEKLDGYVGKRKIAKVIFIDRAVDMIRPLMDQQTYGGVLQENVGATSSAELLNDPVGQKMKGAQYQDLGDLLRSAIARIKDLSAGIKNMSIHEMHEERDDIFTTVKSKVNIEKHVNLASSLGTNTILGRVYFKRDHDMEGKILRGALRYNSGFSDYFYGLMERRSSDDSQLKSKVIRTALLYSLCTKLSNVEFQQLRQDLIQKYGYRDQFILQQWLAKAGLLRPGTPIVQKSIVDILKNENSLQDTLIFVVGGITPDEAAALLQLREELRSNYIVLTTAIMTGNEFIQSIETSIENEIQQMAEMLGGPKTNCRRGNPPIFSGIQKQSG